VLAAAAALRRSPLLGSVLSLLGRVADTVVACCDPDAIVLFGSWAKGTADVHSDVDLLVVGPFRASPWLRDRELGDALGDLAIRFDLHLVTPAELLAAPAHGYLDTLRSSCRVLYARPGVDLAGLGLPDGALLDAGGRRTMSLVEGT
jgi:uncharacterized protein